MFLKIDLTTALDSSSVQYTEIELTQSRTFTRGFIEVRDGRGVVRDSTLTGEILIEGLLDINGNEVGLAKGYGGSTGNYISVFALNEILKSTDFRLTLPAGKHKFKVRSVNTGVNNTGTVGVQIVLFHGQVIQ